MHPRMKRPGFSTSLPLPTGVSRQTNAIALPRCSPPTRPQRPSARHDRGSEAVTFASAVTRGAARQPLLWMALTLSLVLNLCFIAGAAWIRINGPAQVMSPEERFHLIGTELALDPQQRQA